MKARTDLPDIQRPIFLRNRRRPHLIRSVALAVALGLAAVWLLTTWAELQGGCP